MAQAVSLKSPGGNDRLSPGLSAPKARCPLHCLLPPEEPSQRHLQMPWVSRGAVEPGAQRHSAESTGLATEERTWP